MHELSYCEGVLEAVERRAAGRQVAAIGVRVGVVHRVVAEAFQQSFQIAAMDGPAAQAETTVVVVPVSGHCMDCRHDFASADPAPACPACGSLAVAVDGGDEVVLEWLRYVDTGTGDGLADRTPQLVPVHTHAPSDAGDL